MITPATPLLQVDLARTHIREAVKLLADVVKDESQLHALTSNHADKVRAAFIDLLKIRDMFHT